MGHENAVKMCEAAASATGLRPEDFIVASTGVIGAQLNVSVIEQACPTLASLLSRDGSAEAAKAIMTTDTRSKEIAVSFELGGKEVRLGGIAKGSGMIHPNMGTMLAFLTTDCAISSDVLQGALYEVAKTSFNRISVDGDTSTNDTCCILASGQAGNALIDWKNEDYEVFYGALKFICTELAKKIAGDGEGATKLVTCTVSGSRSDEAAEKLAMEIIRSSLVKAAMFGADANWGRVLCAMGYSRAPFRPECVDVSFASTVGTVQVCASGEGLPFDEALAKEILSQPEVEILVNVNEGEHSVTAWGCDLTYDYVKINGDYRT
jgi:glutamate N-acetyltransferase/amino-acid N-acetyltransferase